MTNTVSISTSPIIAVSSARVRHWRSSSSCGRPYRVPYPGQLHDPETDEHVDWHESISLIIRDLPEGSRVSISVQINPPPFNLAEDDYWTLLKPHTYGHVRSGVRDS